MNSAHIDETVLILSKALNLTPEQTKIAREALHVAWEDKLAAVWTVDDVIEIGATVMDRSPTPDEARQVMTMIEADYDPRVGITRVGVIKALEDLGLVAE